MPVPTPPGTGSDQLANNLFIALVGQLNSQLPDIDLFDAAHTIPWDETSDVLKPVTKLEISELVSYFKSLMGGFKDPLQEEFDKGRITGAEYSRTYIALSTTAMQSAVQFALGKDQAFWMAAKTQADAITAANQNELARQQAMLARAQYALTKLQLAATDSGFGSSEYNRVNVLPAQLDLTLAQTLMTQEQAEAQRAQTSDYRTDVTAVTGLIGKQKDLYAQQKQSYIDDAKTKAAKIFADLWITEVTVNDATANPVSDTDFTDVYSTMKTLSGAGPHVP